MNTDQTHFFIDKGCFKYGNRHFFQDLHLTLLPGRFYGLIGPNGSGKSTLIDLLIGARILTSGTIEYKSRPLQGYRRRQLAKYIALVPQQIAVGFDFSVYDIVLMGRHPHIPRFSPPSPADLTKVDEALRLLDVEHIRERPVTTLSGGEKQRVVVARALAQDTETIMLDEATSNLDIEHTLAILRIMRDRVDHSGLTVIAAIHDLNLAAAFCDELIVLKDGVICDQGPVAEVLTREMLRQVFSVKASISRTKLYPQIEYDIFPSS